MKQYTIRIQTNVAYKRSLSIANFSLYIEITMKIQFIFLLISYKAMSTIYEARDSTNFSLMYDMVRSHSTIFV
jgi:hypothetical protein